MLLCVETVKGYVIWFSRLFSLNNFRVCLKRNVVDIIFGSLHLLTLLIISILF